MVHAFVAGAIAAVAGGGSAAPVKPAFQCDAPGCLNLTVAGSSTASGVAGTATYKVSPEGDLFVVLRTTAAPGFVIVVSRYNADAPAAEETFTIDTKRCEDDMDDELDDADGSVSVRVTGGDPFKPQWAAIGSSGTVTIAKRGSVVTGRFDIKACGSTLKDDEDVAVNITGTFKAKVRR